MIIVICGPTGVGKTKISIELAKKYKAIIINADAMQVYKGLDIGTAKIKESEKENIPHYLFDICDVYKNYTIYDYQNDVRNIIKENKDKNIILVGGSGLYIKSALFDYQFAEENKNTIDYSKYTNEELYNLALKKDKNMDIHINNRKRLIRFLTKKELPKNGNKLLYDNVHFIGLTTDREKLYDIINSRVEKQIEEGLVDEVKYFYDNKIFTKALNTGIGYKELFKYFDGKITLDEAIELIKKNTRHYAKRQYTFFNNQLPIQWFSVDYNNFNNTIDKIIDYIKKNKS